MSLLKMSVSDGYGPAVSLGVTAQAALVDSVVIVPEDDVAVGFVGELPHPIAIAALAADPMTPRASRRPIFLMLMLQVPSVCAIEVTAHTRLFCFQYESMTRSADTPVCCKRCTCGCDDSMANCETFWRERKETGGCGPAAPSPDPGCLVPDPDRIDRADSTEPGGCPTPS